VRRQDRIRIVHMPAVVETLAATEESKQP